MLKQNIPNFITLGNLLCGMFAINAIYSNNLIAASWLIALAALFDFADGFVARMLKVSSPMGKELDSLADMVTFGLVPALLMLKLFPDQTSIYRFGMLIIALAAAWRLAKFNIDTRQSDSFLGLPSPANALFIGAIPLIFVQQPILQSWLNPTVCFFIAVFLAVMMVVELPLFALKFKQFGFSENKVRYIFIMVAIILLASLKFIALPLIVLFYILLSLIIHLTAKSS